jgi:DNA primase catalytic core
MARIADDELEQLKSEVSLVRLVEARGIALERHGANLLGRCPFHDDKTPSLVVTPKKNLWHCLGACQSGGSVIDWVMRSEGVSFRHAVELLRADAPSLVASSAPSHRGRQKGPAAKQSTVRKLPPPVQRSAADHELLAQVADYYHASLKDSPEALEYLRSRGLESAEMIEHFRLGYANRTLGYRLPHKTRKQGAELRGRLEEVGIMRESGHEHLSGSVVVPLFDAEGRVVQMYGRKLRSNLRSGTPLHLYLPGPHRGLFNQAAFEASRELIVCEALIDALTFWCAGLRHVSACYGAGGFTAEMREALGRHAIERVYIAFDRDKAGDEGAERLAAELAHMGIEAFRILFPRGMDANAYALKVTPAEQSLRAALRAAEWMAGKPASKRSAKPSQTVDELPAAAKGSASDSHAPPPTVPLVASPASAKAPASSVARASSSPEGRAAYDAQADEVRLMQGEHLWRVRGLSKNSSPGALRVNVLVSREGAGFHVDTLELYSARQRYLFVKMAASELATEEEPLKKEIAVVLLELERLQHELNEGRAATKPAAPELSDSEQEQALALLRDPKLVERVLSDFEQLGVVGERTNKLVAFLSATSRKLDQPLAVVIQSSSAAGKSSLMEAVLSLMPDEERVQYSAMTGQSLFYMGEADLRHKILAIAEEQGAERASYALKLLQSEGELTIASTGKDPHTGRLVTQEYRVEGPVMIMLTTTAIDVDEELLNRCIVLSVDEGREQTRAIHERQRRAQTLAGVLEREERSAIIKLHQNAQRLVRPLTVVNPFAERLDFFDHQTRSRRDHMKYLTLIRAIALLHQHQRELKEVSHRGRLVRYIEVTERDIALADRLAERVLVRSTDELPPQTRRLLGELTAMVAERGRAHGVKLADVRFTRRDVREHTGWSQSQLKTHLQRLEELEYLLVHAGGPRRRMIYELNYDPNWSGQKPTGLGLVWGATRPDSGSDSEQVSDLVAPREGHCSAERRTERVVVDSEPAPAAE